MATLSLAPRLVALSCGEGLPRTLLGAVQFSAGMIAVYVGVGLMVLALGAVLERSPVAERRRTVLRRAMVGAMGLSAIVFLAGYSLVTEPGLRVEYWLLAEPTWMPLDEALTCVGPPSMLVVPAVAAAIIWSGVALISEGYRPGRWWR